VRAVHDRHAALADLFEDAISSWKPLLHHRAPRKTNGNGPVTRRG
jgi:hypothetical protein